MHHARGPATEKYMIQLELNCDNMWKGGRQLCEAVSLTGNHCVNEVLLTKIFLRLPVEYDNCPLQFLVIMHC